MRNEGDPLVLVEQPVQTYRTLGSSLEALLLDLINNFGAKTGDGQITKAEFEDSLGVLNAMNLRPHR